MPWRIRSGGEWWYGAICPHCHLKRGWRTNNAARDHLRDLVAEGSDAYAGALVREYTLGTDPETCACALLLERPEPP